MPMRRYTPSSPLSWTGSPPPAGSYCPLPGTGRVHAGAFSLALRLAEAYSARTLLQSHWSSSAIIIGHVVNTPVPISLWPTRMVTVSSGAIVSHALISGSLEPPRYHGWAATAAAFARLGGSQKPSTIAPPTAAARLRKSRRFICMVVIGVLPDRPPSVRLRDGSRPGCAGTSRIGRCLPSPHRSHRPLDLAAP